LAVGYLRLTSDSNRACISAYYDVLQVVYLTVHNTTVKERCTDWQERFNSFSWKVLSLSENISEDVHTFFNADILVTTAYRWEVASRTREIRRSIAAGKVSIKKCDFLYVHLNNMCVLQFLCNCYNNIILFLTSFYCSDECKICQICAMYLQVVYACMHMPLVGMLIL